MKYCLLIAIFLSANFLSAQEEPNHACDTIYTVDKEILIIKVVEHTSSEISYRKCSGSDTSVYWISRKKILTLIEDESRTKKKKRNRRRSVNNTGLTSGYFGQLNINYSPSFKTNSATELDVYGTLGHQFNSLFALGIRSGISRYSTEYSTNVFIPIMLHFRVSTRTERIIPFIEGNAGIGFPVKGDYRGGLRLETKLGCLFRIRKNIYIESSVQYSYQHTSWEVEHCIGGSCGPAYYDLNRESWGLNVGAIFKF
ncbi:MAG: hypothetical protein ACI837_001956 [Crocinitomicaceae bacterium]|jgi:hypothetical protein